MIGPIEAEIQKATGIKRKPDQEEQDYLYDQAEGVLKNISTDKYKGLSYTARKWGMDAGLAINDSKKLPQIPIEAEEEEEEVMAAAPEPGTTEAPEITPPPLAEEAEVPEEEPGELEEELLEEVEEVEGEEEEEEEILEEPEEEEVAELPEEKEEEVKVTIPVQTKQKERAQARIVEMTEVSTARATRATPQRVALNPRKAKKEKKVVKVSRYYDTNRLTPIYNFSGMPLFIMTSD